MSKLFSDVKKGVNDLWGKYGPRVEDVVKTTAEKAEELTQKARLKYDIYQQQRTIERSLAELGGKVFREITENNRRDFSEDTEVDILIAKIIEEKNTLADLKSEYQNVKVDMEEGAEFTENIPDAPAGEDDIHAE